MNIYYKFSFGNGQTVGQFPSAQSPTVWRNSNNIENTENMTLRLLILLAFCLCLNNSYSQINRDNCFGKDSMQWIHTSIGCLHFQTYKSKKILNNPNLVVIIHGDAPFNKPDYQYKMAKQIADSNKNVIAVAILRPGYTDPAGHVSDGIRGLTTGDNWTPEVINAIVDAIEHFKKVYHPVKTILVGHSGGATISADIIGLRHGLIDKALIVSCPCNVTEWRKYMGKRQPDYSAWKDSVRSISPLDIAGDVNKSTEVIVMSGEEDSIAPTKFSISYNNKLKKDGVKSRLIVLPNKGHEILLSDSAFLAVKTFLSK